MKILLVGEYSRLHNSLKEGLIQLGHEVNIVGSGDGFKNYPVDFFIERKYNTGLGSMLKKLLHRLFRIDITSRAIKTQFFSNSEKFTGYDIVQLINESPFAASPKIEQEIIQFLADNNKKLFLLSCGTDYISVKYAFEKKFEYSIFNPLFDGKISEKSFWPALKYLTPKYKDLHTFVFSNIRGVIASDLDYAIPLREHPKYLGMVPNPVNTDVVHQIPLKDFSKIIIFHGINRANYFKKGNDLFDGALKIVAKKHSDKIEIITAENLPYSEYIEKYNTAHIVLDQVYAYDQGYNALEAMAKGKVVFTGAEAAFTKHYNLKKKVAINALPDVEALVQDLENLLDHPEQIKEIGNNAKEFILKHHYYIDIAQLYLNKWSGY